MKIRIAILLAFACLSTLLFLGVSRAQQPASEQPVYELHYVSVADSKPWKYMWYVSEEGKSTNPASIGIVYSSLDSPTLIQWISDLPKGTEIQYRMSPLPKIGNLFDGPEKELPAFKRFCQSKGIKYEDGFPVL